MIIILLVGSLLVLGGILALFEYLRPSHKKKGHIESEKRTNAFDAKDASVCCGQHAVCEKSNLLSALNKEIEYYNDEELDAYQNLLPETYDEKALTEFSEVFYTLPEEEVEGWVHSLQLRHIALPLAMKEEVLLVLSERRTG